jgi:hypothetical protein
LGGNSVPQDALRVYLGGNAGISHSDDVTVLTGNGINLLSLQRTSKGLAINAKTYSDDGKVITEIIDNRFYINPNTAFRIERPDIHSLVVYDLQDKKVIDVRYINSHSVRVLGIFRAPGAPTCIITENELRIVGKLSAEGSCFGGQRLISF